MRLYVAYTVTKFCSTSRHGDATVSTRVRPLVPQREIALTLYRLPLQFSSSSFVGLAFSDPEFLPRDAMRKRGLCCRPVSLRPSVHPSVTLVDCIHTAEDIVKLLSRPDSPFILVF